MLACRKCSIIRRAEEEEATPPAAEAVAPSAGTPSPSPTEAWEAGAEAFLAVTAWVGRITTSHIIITTTSSFTT